MTVLGHWLQWSALRIEFGIPLCIGEMTLGVVAFLYDQAFRIPKPSS